MISLAIPLAIAEQAVCGQVDPELFFPEKGASAIAPKKLCGVCPVRVECLDWALANDVRHGVWGGLSDAERTHIRRQNAHAVKAPEPAPKPTPKAKPKRARGPVECGTRRGYQRHRSKGEPACDPCRHANAAADRRLRQTGSTLPAA